MHQVFATRWQCCHPVHSPPPLPQSGGDFLIISLARWFEGYLPLLLLKSPGLECVISIKAAFVSSFMWLIAKLIRNQPNLKSGNWVIAKMEKANYQPARPVAKCISMGIYNFLHCQETISYFKAFFDFRGPFMSLPQRHMEKMWEEMIK